MAKRKTDKIMVRYGFSDTVMSLEDVMSDNKEICSCDSYIVGYEDEGGEECDEDGIYLNQRTQHKLELDG